MLDAAKRREFDVLVVSEISALARHQVEVLVIYDMLQRYGVRLETISEKFGEDALSKAILSHRAQLVEVEREQSFLRTERGKADRVAIGRAPRNASTVYTHALVDTEREVKGRYVLNHEVVRTDEDGKQWSRVDVAVFFCDLLARGGSLNGTARILNDMGIPSPRGKQWSPVALQGIVENPILYGEAYANRYKQVRKRQSKNGKRTSTLVLRPKDEWIRLPDAPAVISRETFDLIQSHIKNNKAESLRDEEQPEDVGLLRAGYVFCGVCGYRMHLNRPSAAEMQLLTDPGYLEAATYDDLRLAVKIMGIRVRVYPTRGDWEYRYKIDLTAPGASRKPYCDDTPSYIL